jgi:hypothetical protein
MIAAVITLVIGVFIIPLFIGFSYSISYGIYGTIFTGPAMLVALMVSILIEHYSKIMNLFVMYIKHLLCALTYSLLFSLVMFDSKATFNDSLYLTISISSIYITIFVIFDYLVNIFYKWRLNNLSK